MKKLWIIVGIAGLGWMARADSLDDEIKAFGDAVNSSDAAKTSSAGSLDMAYRLSSMTAQLHVTATTPSGSEQLLGIVRETMAHNSSPDVQKTGKALRDELEARKKARVDSLTAKVNAVLARAPAILSKAQKTEELDGLLADLQIVQGFNINYDPDSQPLMSRLSSAYQFVAQWQDYLSARNSGNTQAAQEALRNLLNSQRNGDAVLVPRSEILARSVELAVPAKADGTAGTNPSSPPPTDVTTIYDGIKTLDDLEPALKTLRALKNSQPYNQTPDFATLSQFATLYEASKNGLPPSLEMNPPNYGNPSLPPEFERIRALLLIYLLPLYIGEAAPAPNPNEAVTDYLNRAIESTAGKQDWVSLQRIIVAETKIAGSQQSAVGARYFLAALNQEMAGQYAQAVGSYQAALRESDDFVPAKVAGERLAAIKKDHAAEYDEGIKGAGGAAPAYANPYGNPAMMRAMMGYPVPGLNPLNGVLGRSPAAVPPGTVPPNPAPVVAPAPAASTNPAPAAPEPPRSSGRP